MEEFLWRTEVTQERVLLRLNCLALQTHFHHVCLKHMNQNDRPSRLTNVTGKTAVVYLTAVLGGQQLMDVPVHVHVQLISQ